MKKLDWHGLKVTPWDDIIDARNIAERIEEIEYVNMDDEGVVHGLGHWSQNDQDEWNVLTDLLAELPESAARYGCTLIRESRLEAYIQEEYSDCPRELYEYNSDTYRHELISWDDLMSQLPFSCINWAAVAEKHLPDYSTVEFLGTTYYYRKG